MNNEGSGDVDAQARRGRRWFVILAVVTLVGFAAFVGTITVLSLRIPKLDPVKFGVLKPGEGGRSR